ncbi:MAG: hypothetical protein ACKO1Y_07705, partial [Actinomycetota bacterium]
PVPTSGLDIRTCLRRAESLEECRYVGPRTVSGLEAAYRKLAREDPGIATLDLDRLVCPYLPICDPVVEGTLVKSDTYHLTPTFAESLAPTIERLLRDRGVLPR